MSKYIFVDIDGTLLNYEHQIPCSAICALMQARVNGHKIFICTGRGLSQLSSQVLDIGWDGIICGDGTFIKVNGQIIAHHALPLADVKKIMRWLDEHHLAYCLETNAGVFAPANFAKAALPNVKTYFKDKKSMHVNQLTVDDLFSGIQFTNDLARGDVNRLSFAVNSKADLEAAQAAFPQLLVAGWGCVNGQNLFGTFGVKGSSKAGAVAELVEYLKIPQGDTYALGDGNNDCDLLQFVNQGIAMGNATPQVKAVANYITKDIDDDGLEAAFTHYQLV